MSIGKVLGFLGITSDVTGFELEPTILAVGLAISVIIQMLKDNAELEITDKDGTVHTWSTNTKNNKRSR
jgi:hypothetical protein